MQLLTRFQGHITRYEWWVGVLGLICIWLVCSILAGFVITGPAGETAASALSMLLFLPLTVLCAKRLRHLERPAIPLAAVLVSPLALYAGLGLFGTLGHRETEVTSGLFTGQATLLMPTAPVWVLLAAVAASLVWMVAVLGLRRGPGDTDPPLPESATS